MLNMLSMIRKGGLPWVLGVLILGGAGLAKAASEIGEVVYLEGRAAAVDGTGARRLLREGARFEAGETLRTLAGSELRLRFDDGALLTLAESSALNLQAYSEVAGGEQFEAELLEGGFRSATGAIARAAPSAYRVATPFAVLGVRGTDYALGLVEVSGAPEVVAGVQEGLIALENSAGSLTLGVNQPFQFARVVSLTAAPQGVAVAPVGLDRYLSLELGPPPAAAGEGEGVGQEGASSAEGGSAGPSGGGGSAGGGGAAGASGAGSAAGAAGAIAGISAATAVAAGLAAVIVVSVAAAGGDDDDPPAAGSDDGGTDGGSTDGGQDDGGSEPTTPSTPTTVSTPSTPNTGATPSTPST